MVNEQGDDEVLSVFIYFCFTFILKSYLFPSNKNKFASELTGE